jgi:Ni/Co efflux regulator RcnB
MHRAAALATLALVLALPAPAAWAQPQHCPPGHAKKGWCEPGGAYRLPPGINARPWRDWRANGLPAPGPGRHYVVVDRDLFLIADATREVVEALGALDRLLRD